MIDKGCSFTARQFSVPHEQTDAGASLGSIKGNLLRPIAVASSKRRAALPNVPTITEVDVPMLASAWYGIVKDSGAPKE